MKKILVVLIGMLMILTGCAANNNEIEYTGETLVVYSSSGDSQLDVVIPAFERETGIKVELVQDSTEELFDRLRHEEYAFEADVMLGGDYASFMVHSNLFEPYVAQNDENVLEEFQNRSGLVTWYVLDGSVIIVNTELVGDLVIEGYEDLLNDELTGQIIMADPGSSLNAYASLTNILLAMGGYEADEAWEYVDELLSVVDGHVESLPLDVYKAVGRGEMAVGLTYEDPALALNRQGGKIQIVYPKEGTVYLPTGAAIVKNSDNLDNAKLFIDFLVSQETQDMFSMTTNHRPVLREVEPSEVRIPYDEIVTIQEDMDYTVQYRDEIIERFDSLIDK